MKYDIEKYLEVKQYKVKLEDELERANAFLKEQEALMDETFNDSLEPEQIDLGNGEFRVKAIGTTIDTDNFILDVQTELHDKFGDKGLEMYKEAEQAGVTIRKSYNRTKFINGLKAIAKDKALDFSGIISAAEENNSQKTIKTKTIEGK